MPSLARTGVRPRRQGSTAPARLLRQASRAAESNGWQATRSAVGEPTAEVQAKCRQATRAALDPALGARAISSRQTCSEAARQVGVAVGVRAHRDQPGGERLGQLGPAERVRVVGPGPSPATSPVARYSRAGTW